MTADGRPAGATITLLTTTDCGYCDHAKEVLARISEDIAVSVIEVSLETTQGRGLAAEHGVLFAPGVLIDGKAFSYGRLSERRLRKTLLRLASA